jgi:hypothetical protein
MKIKERFPALINGLNPSDHRYRKISGSFNKISYRLEQIKVKKKFQKQSKVSQLERT